MKQYQIKLPDNILEPYLFLKDNDGDICYGYVTTEHGGIMIVLTDLLSDHDTVVPCGYVREYKQQDKSTMYKAPSYETWYDKDTDQFYLR